MVFGGGEDRAPNRELLALNEDTIWSGKPVDGNNLDAHDYLDQVRRAVIEKQDYYLADQLCHKMQGLYAEAYQPLGNLRIELDHPAEVTGYRRELDLDTAIRPHNTQSAKCDTGEKCLPPRRIRSSSSASRRVARIHCTRPSLSMAISSVLSQHIQTILSCSTAKLPPT